MASAGILLSAASLFAQTFDTSGDRVLHGDYVVREVLIGGRDPVAGTLNSAVSAMGIATFNGNFTFEKAAPNASSDWRPGSPTVNLPPSPKTCGVTPLLAIADEEALAFEKGTSPDTGDLRPAMAGALKKFQQLVSSVGGTFELKSAYRPPSYQAHLQAVWVKWVLELRNNRESGCQTLRAQVGEEFARHRLLETQKPATSSDHTRGLAFDATVVVPRMAWLKKRRVSLDRLALLAGIQRPDILRDPVHFKLAIGRRSRRA
jgi:hypothetical protein